MNKEAKVICPNCNNLLGIFSFSFLDNPDNVPECKKCVSFKIKDTLIVPINSQEKLTADEITFRFGSKKKSKHEIETTKKYKQVFRKTGDVQTIERTFDRRKDFYSELIVNEDGSIAKEVNEKLSKHIGHGSAKKENKS